VHCYYYDELDVVIMFSFFQCSIQEICELTKDLIIPHKPIEQRQHALVFYKKLIIGQYENLSMMRSHFFRVIEHHKVPEDLAHCLDLLKSLTDSGKDIQYFEEKVKSVKRLLFQT
jgi:tuberous sclerosis 2